MINGNSLSNYKQVIFRDGACVTLDWVASDLWKTLNNYRIPAAFWKEQIKPTNNYGCVDCLMLYHPQHFYDYNWYAFTITRQGMYAFLNIYIGGHSKQTAALNAKNNLMSGERPQGAYGTGYLIGSLIGTVAKGSVHYDKQKHEEETNWYTIIEDIIENVFVE